MAPPFQSERAHVMMTVRRTFAYLALGTTLLGSVAGTANAEQGHVDRVWFSGEEFIVRQIINDVIGVRWCSMVREQTGGGRFDLAAFPGGFVNMVLIDPDASWTPGSVRLRVDDRYWTAQRHVTPMHPDQFSISLGENQSTVSFLSAMAQSHALTFEASSGNGLHSGFRYNVPLSTEHRAMNALIDCAQAIEAQL
jgi:hypothetical protein